SNRDKDDLALADRFVQVGRKTYLPIAISCEQIGKIVFMDERLAGLQRRYFRGIVVHANNVVTKLGEGCGNHQTYMAAADDGNPDFLTHACSFLRKPSARMPIIVEAFRPGPLEIGTRRHKPICERRETSPASPGLK